jgi:hypothetical protein
MWLEHRTLHKFQGPHCLCPLLLQAGEEPLFTEAKILLKDSGVHIGEYVAECPNGRCEYLGRLSATFQDKELLTNAKNSFFGTALCVIWHSGENSCSER